MEAYELKNILKKIKANDYNITEESGPYELALEMMRYIGATDPELRDELIYVIMFYWIIERNVFSKEQLHNLLDISLDEEHLFYRLGEINTDSVFTRSFSVLIVALLINKHRNENYISNGELRNLKEKLIKFTVNERDYRGYVETKGWAHVIAHLADALDELALVSTMEHDDLIDVLDAIKDKVMSNDYIYHHDEDERLTTTVKSIIYRDIITHDEIKNWITDFAELEKSNFGTQYVLIYNIKIFLRSLYFRLLDKNDYEDITKTIKSTLNELSRLTPYE